MKNESQMKDEMDCDSSMESFPTPRNISMTQRQVGKPKASGKRKAIKGGQSQK